MTIQDQITDLPDPEFHALRIWMQDQSRERAARPLVVAREDEIAREYHAAHPPQVDPESGFPQWTQPYGAHDAWPIDATVVHVEQAWDNVAGVPNVWEPGNDGPVPTWRARVEAPDDEDDDELEPEDPQEPVGPPDWEPGVDYVAGDQVTYQGAVYEIVQDHASQAHWAPDAVASLYQAV